MLRVAQSGKPEPIGIWLVVFLDSTPGRERKSPRRLHGERDRESSALGPSWAACETVYVPFDAVNLLVVL